MNHRKGNILAIVLAVLLVIATSAAGYFFWQTRQLNQTQVPKPVAQSVPTATSSPTQKEDTSTSWTNYQVQSTNYTDISLKLPLNLISQPSWVNAGHYYQTFTLPGYTEVAIIPSGITIPQGFENSIAYVTKNWPSYKKSSLMGFEAIDFSGQETGAALSNDLGLVGTEAVGPFHAIRVNIANTRVLEVIHYQNKSASTVYGKPFDYAGDEVLFSKILNTFNLNSSAANMCALSQADIFALINNFEVLQIKKDAQGVLALFTPPVSSDDVWQYSNLMGKSPSPVIGSPRLYYTLSWGSRVQSYQINGQPTTNSNGGCTVKVTEMDKGYSNAGSYVGETPAKPYDTLLDVVNQNGTWKIDKYYFAENSFPNQTKKYSGFGGY